MLFSTLLDPISNLCSGSCVLPIACPNKCPKLWVTGHAGTTLTNHSSALKVVLQPLMNLSLWILEAKWDFSKRSSLLEALVQIKPEKNPTPKPVFKIK